MAGRRRPISPSRSYKARSPHRELSITRSLDRQVRPVINAFSHIVLADRALAKARAIDAAIQAGVSAGPFAGVPFAAKNLFDITGLSTLAGSKINA